MSHLPVIIGFGGINPAGRSSFHHAFRRIIVSKLDKKGKSEVYLGLATMMGYLKYKDGKYYDKEGIEHSKEHVFENFGAKINQNTLLRKISSDLFD
ncbi:MAG: beta-ketoacyl synthase, partial [Chitinispirillia bacterium]